MFRYASLTGVTVVAVAVAITGWAISASENDNFEDGTTQNWAEGAISPNPPTNQPTGGPAGANDNYLQNVSSGGAGAGSRMAMFNRTQWSGNWNAVGPEFTVSMDLNNLGGTAMSIRIGIQSSGFSRFVTSSAVSLPVGSGWQNAQFTVSNAEMTQVLGAETLATALDSVFEFRIVSAASPQWEGDAIAATLGVDNIQVLSVPVELQMFIAE